MNLFFYVLGMLGVFVNVLEIVVFMFWNCLNMFECVLTFAEHVENHLLSCFTYFLEIVFGYFPEHL